MRRLKNSRLILLGGLALLGCAAAVAEACRRGGCQTCIVYVCVPSGPSTPEVPRESQKIRAIIISDDNETQPKFKDQWNPAIARDAGAVTLLLSHMHQFVANIEHIE